MNFGQPRVVERGSVRWFEGRDQCINELRALILRERDCNLQHSFQRYLHVAFLDLSLLQLPVVPHEGLERVELRQAHLVVDGGRPLGPLFRTHPEFARVASGKQRGVFL